MSKLGKVQGFKRWLHLASCFGASIVIIGALFKIMHWPGASAALIGGLGTEAVLFCLFGLDIPHEEVDWTLAYPELAGMGHEEPESHNGLPVSQQLDKMLEEAKVGPELISSLGSGLKSLSDNVSEMSSLSSASVATTEYTVNAQKAAKTMDDISKSSAMVNDAMGSFTGGLSNVLNNLSGTETAASSFKEEIGKLNKNLVNLNTIYGNMLTAMGTRQG